MPDSSATFETVLAPDPWLRRCLLACAVLLPATGLFLLATLPAPWWARSLLATAWIGVSSREFLALRRGRARVAWIGLDGLDNLYAISRTGNREPLLLLSGSVVLDRLAYLRVRFPDGGEYAELIRPRGAGDLHWQRLRLIWRLRRSVIGEPGVS